MMQWGLIGLVIIALTTLTWFTLAWRVSIPRSTLAFKLGWGAGLLLGIVAVVVEPDDALAPWTIALGVMFLYLVSTGAQRAQQGVEVGDVLPAFSATTDSEELFDSASLAGSRVLLKFFRGHW